MITSNIQREQILIPTGIIWELITVATQPVGAPATMGYTITIPEGERAMIFGGQLGPDDYGAGRALSVFIRQAGGSKTMYKPGGGTFDNVPTSLFSVLASITETGSTTNVLGVPYMPFILPELSIIRVTGASLANTETLSSVFWIATRILPPVTAIVGSAVTLTTDTKLQV